MSINEQKQECYRQGYYSVDGKNPYNKESSQRQKFYLFNAGVVDRANGWAYDENAIT